MNILEQINLQSYNTFQIECIADYYCVLETQEDFLELQQTDIYQSQKRLFLGGGSNILLTQERYAGLVIKNEIRGKKIIEETEEYVTIQVGAGENRDTFVARTLQNNYYGCENLISIPGTVGAAPMQNIGAYGVEAKDIIINVQGIDLPSKTEIILANYECNFGYRDSVFKHELKDKFFITQVTFKLHTYIPQKYFPSISYGAIQKKLEDIYGVESDIPLTPSMIASAIAQIRASKLPDRKTVGTAGSFFKNPIVSKEKYKAIQALDSTIKGYEVDFEGAGLPMYKLNAGQLIDLAGLKGLQHGNVGTYHKHALVLINHGNGTGKEVLELSQRIQKIIKETFGIQIEPEVNFVE